MDLALFAVHLGVLAVLWLFVLAVLLVVRSDLLGPRAARATAGRAPAAAARPAQAPPRRAARTLVVLEGPLAGTTLTLGSTPVTIGRVEGCTLVLADEYVSSRHARLVPGEKDWVLEDLESTNGTFVDGQRVDKAAPLRPGRKVRIGKTVFELRR